jgi:hypothetical protein
MAKASNGDKCSTPIIDTNSLTDDTLLDTPQLATVRNIPPGRVEKERLTGDGPPFIKDGHLVRYRWGDYRNWLAAKQRFQSTSEAIAA